MTIIERIKEFTGTPIDENRLNWETIQTSNFFALASEASINIRKGLLSEEKLYDAHYAKAYVKLKSDTGVKRTESQMEAEIKCDAFINEISANVMSLKSDLIAIEVLQKILIDRTASIKMLIELLKMSYYNNTSI